MFASFIISPVDYRCNEWNKLYLSVERNVHETKWGGWEKSSFSSNAIQANNWEKAPRCVLFKQRAAKFALLLFSIDVCEPHNRTGVLARVIVGAESGTSYSSVGRNVQRAEWGGSVVSPTLVLSISWPRQAETDLFSLQIQYKTIMRRLLAVYFLSKGCARQSLPFCSFLLMFASFIISPEDYRCREWNKLLERGAQWSWD